MGVVGKVGRKVRMVNVVVEEAGRGLKEDE